MKKAPPVLFAMVLSGVMATDASAQTVGKLSCATWVSGRNQGGSQALQVENQLDGYLSGLSDGSGYNVFPIIDQPSGYPWMDSYCRAHPSDNVADAGAFLINEVLKKKRPYKHQY